MPNILHYTELIKMWKKIAIFASQQAQRLTVCGLHMTSLWIFFSFAHVQRTPKRQDTIVLKLNFYFFQIVSREKPCRYTNVTLFFSICHGYFIQNWRRKLFFSPYMLLPIDNWFVKVLVDQPNASTGRYWTANWLILYTNKPAALTMESTLCL